MADAEIAVGRIVRAHGLRGQLVIQPASPGSDVLLHVRSVVAEQAGKREPLTLRDARQQGKLLLVAFEGYSDRTAAESLVGSDLFLRADALPPPAEGEFYVTSLIGLEVVSPTGTLLGKVVEIESAGTQNWLVVEAPTGRHLVPFAEPLVRIDLPSKRVIIDAPEGLLDGKGE